MLTPAYPHTTVLNTQLSEKCTLGCWALGGKGWGPQDPEVSIKTIKAAYESGITRFDTAQSYGNGYSEQLLGRALKNVRDRVFIASKAAFRPGEAMLKAVDISLRRLNTDCIDLYYIHWPQKGANLGECVDGLMRAREQGKIRHIGVSNFSVEQIREVMRAAPIHAHQLCYNLLWRREEREVIPFCCKNEIKVITYSTIAQGILSGKFKRDISFPPGDHRKSTLFFDPQVWPLVYETVNRFKTVSEQANRSLLELAIRWVCENRVVSSVIVGARNVNQVRDLVNCFGQPVERQVLEQLQRISGELSAEMADEGNIFRYYP